MWTNSRQVLILTNPTDAHLPPVAEEIRQRGAQVYSVDQADFPEHMTLTTTLTQGWWSGNLITSEQRIDINNLTSIWRRRPKAYQAPHIYSPGERSYIEDEATHGFLGTLESLHVQGTLWVSRTHSIRRAELKPLQLAAAQRLGLRIPRTLITNKPEQFQEFYEECNGNVILKPLGQGKVKNEDSTAVDCCLFTSIIEQQHVADLKGIQVTSHLFQEHIAKRIELRVVVIGKQVFAAEIHSQQSERSRLDFRRAYDDLTYDVHILPQDLKNKVLSLVRYFDLQFSSMDFVVTPQDEYIFLDQNPNGQWYWIQLALGDRLPLKEAMADLLVYPEEFALE